MNFRELLNENKNYFIMITGRRRTGKTFLLRELLHQTKDWYEDCHIFSSTIEYQRDAYDFCPIENTYDHFNEQVIEGIYNEQYNRLKGLTAEEKKDKHLRLLIFDDLAHAKKIINCNIMKKMATSGRHNNLCVVILSQYLKMMEPTTRQNLDLVCTFPMGGEHLETFARDYFNGGSVREKMERLSPIISKEFTCCVVNLVSRSLKFEDNTYEYKANKTPSFKIGSRKKKAYSQNLIYGKVLY